MELDACRAPVSVCLEELVEAAVSGVTGVGSVGIILVLIEDGDTACRFVVGSLLLSIVFLLFVPFSLTDNEELQVSELTYDLIFNNSSS